ncbi:hypothetical protein F5Y18DRAFT_424847 [Xylariaceae sp. FL1019]|nr:hypothetical protein F5Y18DRAFT_424847 [Xylariaceae sp. FL1019]
MQFRQTIISIALFLQAHQGLGAAIGNTSDIGPPGQILVATDPYYACNCPNNCSHKENSKCKYHIGPSDGSPVAKGVCAYRGGSLSCVVRD